MASVAAACGRTAQSVLDELACDAAGFDGGADPLATWVAA
jgi:hypothetical protein